MTHKQTALIGILLTILLPWRIAFAEQILQSYEIRYRPAQQIAQQIRPMLDPQTRMSVSGNLLLIRATRSELAHISTLLQTLDRPLRNYLVTVMRNQGEGRGTAGLNLQTKIPIGRQGQVNFGTNNADRTQLRVYSTQSQRSDQKTQQLRVTEGTPAFISTGKVVPVRNEQIRSGRDGREVSRSVTFHEAQDGFFVTITPYGSQIQVDISAFMEDIDPKLVTPSNALQTTVQVIPSEWFIIGAQNSGDFRRSDGVMVFSTRDQRGAHTEVMLKVDEQH